MQIQRMTSPVALLMPGSSLSSLMIQDPHGKELTAQAGKFSEP
jgi:hypothetical protein